MNLSRSYEINKSGTIFVAKRIDALNILTNNALIIWPPTLNLKKLLFICTVEPPRKGHFGTNINSSGLSPL